MVLNAPMSVSLLLSVATEEEKAAILSAHRRSVGCVISDGMGALVEEADVRELPILEPGTAWLEDLRSDDIKVWMGQGSQGMTTLSRLSQIRQAMDEPSPELSTANLSTQLLIFGETSTGMTSADDFRSPKQRSKDTCKKGRRS